MPTIQSAQQVLDRHYLEIRCGLLDLAAALDRLERSDGFDQTAQDPRLQRVQEGLKIVASAGNDRAERLQMLFSDAYVPQWK
ncbi:MAG: hypothetical protein DWH91_11720 [Planctomycetota bacterium]|nr:MAG: hypothetical protein DWH91_11720 [Planctomycetota bacterium]